MLVLGHPETGNPKDMTQQDSTSPQRTCLIGICKDMMSSMNPSRKAGLQDEVARTFLVTRKFSSSIFCWKGLHKLQEDESKNTKCKPWRLHVGASGKGPSSTFYSRKGSYWRTTRDATVKALTDAFMDTFKCAIMQILHTVTSHVSTQ